jgi:hypothetical protein
MIDQVRVARVRELVQEFQRQMGGFLDQAQGWQDCVMEAWNDFPETPEARQALLATWYMRSDTGRWTYRPWKRGDTVQEVDESMATYENNIIQRLKKAGELEAL